EASAEAPSRFHTFVLALQGHAGSEAVIQAIGPGRLTTWFTFIISLGIGYMRQVVTKAVPSHEVEGFDGAERALAFDSFSVGQPAAVVVLVTQGLELAFELAEYLEIQ